MKGKNFLSMCSAKAEEVWNTQGIYLQVPVIHSQSRPNQKTKKIRGVFVEYVEGCRTREKMYVAGKEHV